MLNWTNAFRFLAAEGLVLQHAVPEVVELVRVAAGDRLDVHLNQILGAFRQFAGGGFPNLTLGGAVCLVGLGAFLGSEERFLLVLGSLVLVLNCLQFLVRKGERRQRQQFQVLGIVRLELACPVGLKA